MPTVRLCEGDANDVLVELAAEGVQVHSVVTDPPYYLESIVKRFGKEGSKAAKAGTDGRFARQSRGFMERTWDGGDNGYKIAHDPEFWRRVYNLLLPGGYCLAFSHASTGHHQAVAMEAAGFKMHPFIAWTYHTGFPKAHAIHKPEKSPVGTEEWEGWYHSTQTLKPALEPIYVGQKPFSEKTGIANVLKHGAGAMNVDACRGPGDRWPSNLLTDGSPEVGARVPLEYFASFPLEANIFHHGKATKEDRAGSDHATVKPVALLRHLVRLVTPKYGFVLDPFAGSGTTGQAAMEAGMNAILVERELDYITDIKRRFDLDREEMEDGYAAILRSLVA